MAEKSNNLKFTTIKLEKSKKARLDKLKTHKKDSYNDVIDKILNILNICKANPERARAKLRAIDRTRLENKLSSKQIQSI